MDMQAITSAAALPDGRLRLTFGDGFQGIVNSAAIAARGGVLSILLWNPGAFTISDRGRALIWHDADGDEVDLCADALRLAAEAEQQAAE